MRLNSKPAFLLIFALFLNSCYTSTNLSTIKFEVLITGKVQFPAEYKMLAVRYNNCNISYNEHFSVWFEDNKKIIDITNIDSTASEIYFQNFITHLKYQQFFDTVFQIEQMNFTDIRLDDSLINIKQANFNPFDSAKQNNIRRGIVDFTKMMTRFSPDNSRKFKTKFIDPEFCLYSVNDIRQIADSTGADLFLSLDFFASKNGIFTSDYKPEEPDTSDIYDNTGNIHQDAIQVVHILSGWNLYDLREQKLIYSHLKTDTVQWTEPAYTINMAKRVLPPRKDAVLNAADIAGKQFAAFLVPNWVEVERKFYNSPQVEMKKAGELAMQNQWLEAAEIWRKLTNDENKKLASKSMFNMALACEFIGDIDAATDWIKKALKTNHKDPYHKGNCQSYNYILEQRKLEIAKIDN